MYLENICTPFDVHLSTPVKTASSNKLEGRYLESFKLARGMQAWEQVAVYIYH
jgi:hypothetical protein